MFQAQWDGKVEKIVTNDFDPITAVDSYSSNDELKWGRNIDFKLRYTSSTFQLELFARFFAAGL